ncbi:ESX secretion-associated protein EspG [Nocardia asteroides]
MNRTWKLPDLEFLVLWEWSTSERLPWPFYCATRSMNRGELERQKREALNEVRRAHPELAREVMEALTGPDVQITVSGHDGSDDMKVDTLTRIFATRRGDAGYVVVQKPGETYWHSGGYTITECPALHLAENVVEELPEVDAGREPEFVLPVENEAEELDYGYARSVVHDSFDDSVHSRAQRFLSAPAHYEGTVEVVQGRSLFGPRGITSHEMRWRDMAGDGRYVITGSNPTVAAPADSKRFVQLINVRIAEVIRAIKDERV